MEGRRRGQLSSALSKEQAISGPFKSGFSHSYRKAGTEGSPAGRRHLLGRDLQPPRGIWAVTAGRMKHFSRGRTCSCPKSEETFRSPPVPTIPWLLHQLWVFMGAAPVTPVTHENLGVFWEKGGNYLGRTVASLLNLAPQLFRGVNMEIRVNKTHGGKMYDSNLH